MVHIRYIIIIFCLAFSLLGWSQSDSQRKKLEARKEQLLKEISLNEKLLKDQRTKERSIVTQIEQQKIKIDLRQKLIETTENQSAELGKEIRDSQKEVDQLAKEVQVLKEDYARMIVKSYKSKSEQSRMMFVLSSKDFLQAYKRIQYMKQYAAFQKSQGEEIARKAAIVEQKIKALEVQKEAKERLIAEQEKERLQLEKEKKEQEKLVNSIKRDQRKITDGIKKRRTETANIDKKIDKLIKDAIAEANRKAAAAAKKSGTKTTTSSGASKSAGTTSKFVLTPEGKITSDNFKANQGKLSWPVEKGFVSLRFGNNPHPVIKSLDIPSNGIEITTEKGSRARAVFKGEVLKINVFSPTNKAVFIQHGDFITVYQNLSTIDVAVGQKVTEKQIIGTIHTNVSSGKTAIKFCVLQNDKFLNPTNWLTNM